MVSPSASVAVTGSPNSAPAGTLVLASTVTEAPSSKTGAWLGGDAVMRMV